MRVVVTGATGFIGRHLCAQLVSDGMQVVALGRRSPEGRVEYQPCADLVSCPLTVALRGANALVHLAGLAHERAMAVAGKSEPFMRVNADATERLAREAAAAKLEHFVFLSTIKVFGEETHGVPFTEQSTEAPSSPYGRSKLEAEHRLARISAETGLRVTVLRPTLVYGPGNTANFLQLLRIVDRGWPLPLGAVRNRRNLVYVGNLVSAIAATLRSRTMRGSFIACDRKAFSTTDLVRGLAHAMGREVHLFSVPPALLGTAAAIVGRSDAARRVMGSLEADPSKLERELAWSAPYSAEEGLRITAQWYLGTRR